MISSARLIGTIILTVLAIISLIVNCSLLIVLVKVSSICFTCQNSDLLGEIGIETFRVFPDHMAVADLRFHIPEHSDPHCHTFYLCWETCMLFIDLEKQISIITQISNEKSSYLITYLLTTIIVFSKNQCNLKLLHDTVVLIINYRYTPEISQLSSQTWIGLVTEF